MADFYQMGCVTTLHRLKPGCSVRMENELKEMAGRVAVCLVLPALYSEFGTPAMRRIANELAEIPYLRHIVVALGRAGSTNMARFSGFSRDFYTRPRLYGLTARRCRICSGSWMKRASRPARMEKGDRAGSQPLLAGHRGM